MAKINTAEVSEYQGIYRPAPASGRSSVGPCIHCDERPAGADGTIYCQPCLDWQREDYAAEMNGTPRPTWGPFDPDDVEARYGTPIPQEQS